MTNLGCGGTLHKYSLFRIDDDTREKGYRLVGDVAFDEVESKAKAISPVPDGMGPMTITMLMKNTVRAAKRTVEG